MDGGSLRCPVIERGSLAEALANTPGAVELTELVLGLHRNAIRVVRDRVETDGEAGLCLGESDHEPHRDSVVAGHGCLRFGEHFVWPVSGTPSRPDTK